MALPHLIKFSQTFYKDQSASDEAQVPVEAAVVTVYKQGCTITGGATVLVTPTVLTVRDSGRLVVGDTVQLGTDSTKQMTVTAITSRTSITLNSTIGSSIVVSAGQRLVIYSNLPTLYSESTGVLSTPNPTTTSSTGLCEFYTNERYFDLIVTGSGITTTLYINFLGGVIGPEGLNVKDFGAVGDGTTDDAAAIRAAFDALPADNGGRLVFPNGDYLIKSTLDFGNSKPVILDGTAYNNDPTAPAGCSIVKASPASGWTSGTEYAIKLRGRCQSIRNMTIRGQSGNTGGGVVIEANSCALENVLIDTMGGIGVVIGGVGTSFNVNHWQLIRCIIRLCTDGVYIESDDGGGGPNANAGLALNLVTHFNSGYGIHIVKGAKNSFIACTNELNTLHGVRIEGNSGGNAWFGGDIESNNGGFSNPQVDLVSTGVDTCFFNAGMSGPVNRFPGSRTLILPDAANGQSRLPGYTGEQFSNGPYGGTPTGNGSWWSIYGDDIERIRMGVREGVPLNLTTIPNVPAQLLYDTASNTFCVVARDVSTGKVKLFSGTGLAGYLLLDHANAKVEINENLKLVPTSNTHGYIEMTELSSDAAAPSGGSNTGRVYMKDNGGGKTQLVVRFPTGAVQVIATEP